MGAQSLVQTHEVQLVNYLATTGIETGLLLNFGASSLQIKRKYRTYRAKGKTGLDALRGYFSIL
ncbi:MAG TPA: GxxExxY protein [Deltaproteobacteria bacterium]|nr:GxxExxY protein [Deltaproteobacteria bacterium]HIJ76208.1 GxxExxY protein [Deltaproteobacteria bacterium]